MHRSYYSCSMHPQPPGLYPNLDPLPARSRGVGGQTLPSPDSWRSTLYASSVIFSAKCRPIECRKSVLLRPTIAKFPQGNICPWIPSPAPWSSTFGAWVLGSWCLKRSTFWQIQPPPPLHSKGWLPACLLPCYRFAHAVGRVAPAERLLTQLLSSRSEGMNAHIYL